MRASSTTAFATAIALGSLAFVAGCDDGKDPYAPGSDPLGTFSVTGHVTSNSCGASNAPDPWVFDVKLSEDPGATLYWIQNDLPVSGKLDTTNHAALTSSDSTTLASDKNGNVICAVERDDSLDTTLTPDPGNAKAVTTFAGTLSYSFKQSDGLDCSSQLTASGGTFDALPCTITYAITGSRTALPNQYGK